MLKVDDINIRYGMNIRVYAGKSLPGMARFCHHFQQKRKSQPNYTTTTATEERWHLNFQSNV